MTNDFRASQIRKEETIEVTTNEHIYKVTAQWERTGSAGLTHLNFKIAREDKKEIYATTQFPNTDDFDSGEINYAVKTDEEPKICERHVALEHIGLSGEQIDEDLKAFLKRNTGYGAPINFSHPGPSGDETSGLAVFIDKAFL